MFSSLRNMSEEKMRWSVNEGLIGFVVAAVLADYESWTRTMAICASKFSGCGFVD